MKKLLVLGIVVGLMSPLWAAKNENLPKAYQDHLVGKRPSPFGEPQAQGNMPLAQPLERFDISAFRVVTIMWGERAPRAVVIDPYQNKHTLRLNDRIGNNNGFVAAINEGEIVILEEKPKTQKKVRRVLRLN